MSPTKRLEKISIVTFRDEFAVYFDELNKEWLEKYFYVEEYDQEVLTKPKKYILDRGGEILFALCNNKVVGTVALIKREENTFELSKMAVTVNFQGLGIGKKLIYSCIDYCVNKGINRLFLDSNRKLKPAISLYEKLGFKEIPVPKDTPYDRCDIRMEIRI